MIKLYFQQQKIYICCIIFCLLSCSEKTEQVYKDMILLDTVIGKNSWSIGYSDTIIPNIKNGYYDSLPKLFISYNCQKVSIELTGIDSILHNKIYSYQGGKINKFSFFSFCDSLYALCVAESLQIQSGVIIVKIQSGRPYIMPISVNNFGDKYLILGEPMILQREKKRIAYPLLEHHWESEFVGDVLVWEVERDSVAFKGLLETDAQKINSNDSYIREIDSLLFWAKIFKKYKNME